MKRKELLILFVVALLVIYTGLLTTDRYHDYVFAQGPDEIVVTLEEGIPYVPIQTLDVPAGECAELPILIDNSGSEQLPDGFPVSALRAGDFVTVAEFMGLEVDDRYGCQYAQPGQLYMDFRYAEFRCGPATLIAHAQDAQGNGLPNILLANNWPNMGDADQFAGHDLFPRYFPTGILAFTNGDGNVGWGLGTGSYLTPHVGGPHNVWSIAGSGPLGTIVGSDAALGIGMLPMSNHCILNPQFEVRQKAGSQTVGNVRLAILENGNVLGYIYPVQGVPEASFSGLELQDEQGNSIWHVPSEGE